MPSQIDEMEMLDVLALFEYWSEWPPTHEILKIVHGAKPDKTAAPIVAQQEGENAIDPSGIADLFNQFPGGVVRAS